MAEQGKICSIFIKKGQVLVEERISEDFSESTKLVSLQTVRMARSNVRPNASHRKLVFDVCSDVNHKELLFATPDGPTDATQTT
jgi:hypothetical protein